MQWLWLMTLLTSIYNIHGVNINQQPFLWAPHCIFKLKNAGPLKVIWWWCLHNMGFEKNRDTLPRPNLQFGSIWNILGHHDKPWFLLENEQQTNTVKAKPTPADHNFQIISPCLIVSALFWKDFPRYSGETLTINVEIKKLWNLLSSGSKTLIHTCPILDGLQTMISSWLGKWWNKNSKCKSINPRFIHI